MQSIKMCLKLAVALVLTSSYEDKQLITDDKTAKDKPFLYIAYFPIAVPIEIANLPVRYRLFCRRQAHLK